MILQHIIYIPVLVGLLAITLFTFLRNAYSSINLAFGLLTSSIFLWLSGLYISDTFASSSNVLFWIRIGLLFSYFMPLTFLLFSLAFPSNKKISFKKVLLLSLPALSLSVFSFSNFIVKKVEIQDSVAVPTELGLGYTLYLIYLVLYFLAAFIIFIRKLKISTNTQKNQIKLVFTGTLVGAVINIVFNVVFVLAGITGVGLTLGAPSILIFIMFIMYAIFRHKLFDIRFVVARSLGYLLSVSMLALLYGIIAFSVIGTFIFSATTSEEVRQGTYTLLAVILAFTFQPLKRFFDRLSNTLFYRDAYDSQEFLDEFNKVIVSTIDLDKLLSNSSRVMTNTIKSDFSFFCIKSNSTEDYRMIGSSERQIDQERVNMIGAKIANSKKKSIIADELQGNYIQLQSFLRDNNIAAVLRLTKTPKKQDDDTGFIILGNKKSGAPFSGQDIKVLEIIADEMVIAIQNALRFEEIQKFNITLQEKVDDATKKLRNANKKLIELDQSKDDFISMASHQLRTPLTSIKGYVSMVMEGDAGKISKKQNDLLNQSFLSAQRMVYLIADLLNVSRLRTGKFIIEPKKTNLAEVIEGEMSQLTETAKGRDIKLAYKKPAKFPDLMLDETKIRQVIMNFIDNAIYYTPGGGSVVVNLKDAGEAIEFTVVDDGIGVPKNVQHNLFNKFYRADNAKKARPDGTGLGLFMAKKVVVAQGGSVIFNSQEGKGSTFGFSFTKKPILPENFKGVTADRITD